MRRKADGVEGRRLLPSPCVPFVHCLASVVTSFPPRPPISSSPVRTTGGAGRSPGRSDGDEMGGMRKGWGAGHEWRVTRGAAHFVHLTSLPLPIPFTLAALNLHLTKDRS